ncbi:MAG: L-histidine N(alpha)-methyltransferase [Acidobacteriota bacterium]
MQYFKHSELAKRYHVSLRTVHNWIDATKLGKLDLDLHPEGNKTYVANTARNIATLTKVVEDRRKYRNKIAVKVVKPKPEFYAIYNEHQIYDIATNLEIHREIPRQYNYFNGGAGHWDEYAERLVSEKTPNAVNSTIKLLRSNRSYLDELLASYKQVNVIDIGVGNAYPVKELLTHLVEQGKLGRYIALDISPEILKIAETNIQKWFGDKVKFEGYERDINYDRFSDLLIQEYTKKDANDTLNLMLLLGGTLSNMRTPDGAYKIIHDSMNVNDLLVFTKKLDTEETRRYFDFSLEPGETRLAAIHGLVVDLLNIDRSYYTVELGYDPDLRQRFEHIRLKVSLVIKLEFKDGVREIELNKGSVILTWRAHQQTANDVLGQFDHNDFHVLHSSQTADQDYILTVSRVKRDR